MHFVVSLLLVVVLASCDEPLAPPRAMVSAKEVTEQSSSEPGQLSLTVTVRVENVTDGDIYFNFCASTLEREAAPGRWDAFGGVVCNAIGYADPLLGMLRIQARSVREMPLHLYSWGHVGVDVFGSTYRLQLSIATPTGSAVARRMGYNHMTQSLATNEFTLTQ